MDKIEIQGKVKNESSVEDEEISLFDIIEVLVKNIRTLIAVPVVLGLIGLGVAYLIPPKYTASTLFLPPQQQASAAAGMLQSLGALGGLAGAAAGIKNPSDQYIAFLKTRVVQDAVIDKMKLKSHYEADFNEDYRKILLKNSNISSGKDNIIKIEVTDKNQKMAADIANEYVKELGVLVGKFSVTEAQSRRAFFEKQLSETKEKLTQAQVALAASGVSLDALNMNPGTAIEGPARLKAQVTAQEVKIASMRSYLTERAPEFKQALNELAELKKKLDQFQTQDERGNGTKSSEYIAKYREYKYQETLFDIFSRQYELARVDEGREGPMIQVVDYAEPPEKKSSPKKLLIALGAAIAGFFFCLIYIFVRRSLESARSNPSDAEKLASLRSSLKKQLGI